VVLRQAAQDRLALGNVDMVRPVMPNQNEALVEIDRMELGEAASDIQAIHYQHCYAGLKVGLAAHGKAGGREQRIADD